MVFLDDDVVVHCDQSPLWDIDLNGKVNGAVETCKGEDRWVMSKRFRNYFNFSHPRINLKSNLTVRKLGTLPPALIAFKGLVHPLDSSWHMLGLGYQNKTKVENVKKAAVIHYNGQSKSWLEIGFEHLRLRIFGPTFVLSTPLLRACMQGYRGKEGRNSCLDSLRLGRGRVVTLIR
ncbi:hypothetical protein BC332_03754 [Capsicum chinense]|nr:hypothetical protein BC332_03754 [Capsicum chinense]